MLNQTSERIAFVGSYPPRQCGIATFTHDLRTAIAQMDNKVCNVLAMDDIRDAYAYPDEVCFKISEQDLESYRRAADYINSSNYDVISLQHEFGVYGGPAGGHILAFLRDVHVPVVTTLHTVLNSPTPLQRRVMEQVIELSTRVVVMTERSRLILIQDYQLSEKKIDLIVHGIPEFSVADVDVCKDQFGVQGRKVGLTFGLLSPNKGIEYVLQSMPAVVKAIPDYVYIVLGVTHPSLVRAEGEAYRIRLETLARDLGIEKHVIFYNRFVEIDELTEFIGAADLYITPYLNENQAVSGALAYSFGSGQAVISTPYWHAVELLADDRGVLVPFKDAPAIGEAIISLLQDDDRRNAIRARAYQLGRQMTWKCVSELYARTFEMAAGQMAAGQRAAGQMAAGQRAAGNRHPVNRPLKIRTLDELPLALPEFRLDHLLRMTDSTGMFQHACHSIPNQHEGYCVDDNARALILTVLLEELGRDSPVIHQAASTYAAFLNHAYNPAVDKFRNFMSFDRRWLEAEGSEDSQGRVIWALGTCAGRSRRRSFQLWAMECLQRALPSLVETTSPRCWAFCLIGIYEYLRRFDGDRLVTQIAEQLTEKLVQLYEATATEDWPWFEDIATYDNPKLSHALILSGRWSGHERALEIGLQSLKWLAEQQKSTDGRFRPIGCLGFFRRDKPAAKYDQQPIEAQAMVSAAIEAFSVTEDLFWCDQTHLAFDWFLGRNDLWQPIFDASTGGCRDGLQNHQINQNQGAESTLAYLLSLAEMYMLENSLVAFHKSDGSFSQNHFAKQPLASINHAY